MKAIILAAGEGKRLRPYTKDRPKCMVEIKGVSLLDRQISIIKSMGIEEIIIIGGYKAETLISKGTKLIINTRYQDTNMVWSLFCGEDELVGDLIICYGDIVYSLDILSKLLNCEEDIAVTIDVNWEQYWRLRNEDPLADAETLKLRNDGTISEIGQVPLSIDEIDGQYMGLLKFSREGIKLFRESFTRYKKSDSILNKKPEIAFMTDLIMQLIKDGVKVQSVPINCPWIEIDTKEDLTSSYTLERLSSIEEGFTHYQRGVE